jgi:cytochrome P450
MEEGKVSKKEDFLSIVISIANDQGHLATYTKIKDNILTFLFAGHDTTSCGLAVLLKAPFSKPTMLTRDYQR